jgi:hypothetical protein
MRLFRRKSSSPSDHQEYLSDLISSIRQAKREELEQQDEKPGLHSFIEDDYFPGGKPGPAKVPPGLANDAAPVAGSADDADAVADLEAYLSELNAAEEAAAETAAEDDEPV